MDNLNSLPKKCGEGISARVLTPNDWLAAHWHPIGHQGVLLEGEASIRIGETWFDRTAPWIGEFPANIEHEVRLKDGCARGLFLSIYPHLVMK